MGRNRYQFLAGLASSCLGNRKRPVCHFLPEPTDNETSQVRGWLGSQRLTGRHNYG
jgi:hypothetical protein